MERRLGRTAGSAPMGEVRRDDRAGPIRQSVSTSRALVEHGADRILRSDKRPRRFKPEGNAEAGRGRSPAALCSRGPTHGHQYCAGLVTPRLARGVIEEMLVRKQACVPAPSSRCPSLAWPVGVYLAIAVRSLRYGRRRTNILKCNHQRQPLVGLYLARKLRFGRLELLQRIEVDGLSGRDSRARLSPEMGYAPESAGWSLDGSHQS
jgi:hypothetical protein